MSKKEILYPASDGEEILRLAKLVNVSIGDCDSIYAMYKKYILPSAGMYSTNCNCSVSISRYFQTLLDWYLKNGDLFE